MWRRLPILVLLLTLGACAAADAGSDAGSLAPDASITDARISADGRMPADARISAAADAAEAADAGIATDAATDARSPDAGGILAYAHTIAIDGVNDFSVIDEKLATTSAGFDCYISWDDTYVYVAMQGSDVGSTDPSRFVLIYIGRPGVSAQTMTGVSYNTQQPSLPTGVGYHVRWKADNTFTDALLWNGAAWADAGWNFAGDFFQSGDFLELRIPRADIGSPTRIDIHVSMINESNGAEGTFAGTPGASFSDGYDPDYARYFRFDLEAAPVPSSYAPRP